MKNPLDNHCHEAESLLEDYLDHFCSPLIGAVPQSERINLRREVASHIEMLAMEYEWQGKDPVQSMLAAVREMGEPWVAGEMWLAEWNVSSQAKSLPSRFARVTFVRPFAFFGVATMINLLALEYLMQPLDNIALPPYMLVLILLSPIVAGSLTGYQQTAHLSRSIFFVLLGLGIDSFVTGLLMLPKNEVLIFAAVQIGIWIPLGTGSACLTAALMRSQRRHSFVRLLGRAE